MAKHRNRLIVPRALLQHPHNPLLMLVPLGGKTGGYAVIDLQDAQAVGAFNWTPCKHRHTTYAHTKVVRPDGGKTTLRLHRLVARLAGFGYAAEIDHENHDGLDCRRSNLRPATHSQNMMNRARVNPISGFKGVGWHKQMGKWRAYIQASGRYFSLGLYADVCDAARAYDAAAQKHFGSFACLNFSAETTEHAEVPGEKEATQGAHLPN